MKRLSIIVGMMITFLCIGFVGCAKTQEPAKCEHEYESDYLLSATCESNGLEILKCSLCDEEKTVVLEKLPHVRKAVEAIEPTCSTVGRAAGEVCLICDAELSGLEEIPKIEHTKESKELIAATCAEYGASAWKCSVCSEIGTDLIEKLPHKNTGVVTLISPTCTSAGQNYLYCYDCKNYIELIEKIPALGHTEQVLVEAVPYNCVTSGRTAERICITCNKVLEESEEKIATGHTLGTDNICTVCGYEQLDYFDDFEYELSSDGTEYTLTGMGTVTETDLVIPNWYNGKPVTGITGFRLYYDTEVALNSVVISEGIKSVSAFNNQNSIIQITFPESYSGVSFPLEKLEYLSTVIYNAEIKFRALTFEFTKMLKTVICKKKVDLSDLLREDFLNMNSMVLLSDEISVFGNIFEQMLGYVHVLFYVPTALIEEYRATVDEQYASCFKTIEGSEYEYLLPE